MPKKKTSTFSLVKKTKSDRQLFKTTTKRADAIESKFFNGFELMIDCEKKNGEPSTRQTRYRNSFPVSHFWFSKSRHCESHKQNLFYLGAAVTQQKPELTSAATKIPKKKQLLENRKK